jgi:hypothetical protein
MSNSDSYRDGLKDKRGRKLTYEKLCSAPRCDFEHAAYRKYCVYDTLRFPYRYSVLCQFLYKDILWQVDQGFQFDDQ